jgi:hypothetical protein
MRYDVIYFMKDFTHRKRGESGDERAEKLLPGYMAIAMSLKFSFS